MPAALTAAALAALLAAGQPAAPAAGMATAAETCPGPPAALPPALSGWAVRAPLAAAAGPAGLPRATLMLGRGADVALSPAAAVAFVAPPGKPAPEGGRAGLLAFEAPAAGTYAVGLSTGAWIDVVDSRGAAVASAAHGRGPPCSGVRKLVDFPLAAGRYVIQLTGSDAVAGVIVIRRLGGAAGEERRSAGLRA